MTIVVDSLPVRRRPLTLENIAGQKFCKQLLKGAILRKKLPKTILLTGPPGTGKTTTARIIGTYVNCQKIKGIKICLSDRKNIKLGRLCLSCKAALKNIHPDIHELNSANSRKIEDVRTVISYAEHSPTFNTKVFILDEMQQITDPGINALLKPLEEPPEKTMWILASMMPDKIPGSVLSRCTIIPMTALSNKETYNLLKHIADKEKVKLSIKVYKWLSSMSNNIPRDSVSLLDSLINIMAAKNETEMENVSEYISETIIKSGILGTGPTALVILALLYVRSPIVFAFLQKGVTDQLLRDLYYFQDSFVAHLAFGNKSWRWKTALKTIKTVLKNEIRFSAYQLDVKFHIALSALLGKALVYSRTLGDPGVALRQAISEWWLLNIKENMNEEDDNDDD